MTTVHGRCCNCGAQVGHLTVFGDTELWHANTDPNVKGDEPVTAREHNRMGSLLAQWGTDVAPVALAGLDRVTGWCPTHGPRVLRVAELRRVASESRRRGRPGSTLAQRP